jgi:hypothetical protein
MRDHDLRISESTVLNISGLPITLPLDTYAQIENVPFDNTKDRVFEIVSPNFTVPSWDLVFRYERSDDTEISTIEFTVTPSISGRVIVLVDKVLPPIVGGFAAKINIGFRPRVAAGHIGDSWPIPSLSNLVNVNW